MTTIQPPYEPALTFDFRQAIAENRLKGIWKMMVDFRAPYIGATAALAISALAKTFTYMLLRFFVDDVLTQGEMIGNSLTQTFLWMESHLLGWHSSKVDLRSFRDVWLLSPLRESRAACATSSSIIFSV